MTRRNAEPYPDILSLVGWTPLVRLNRITEGIRTPVYGKCEFMNPGGSVKDRIGRAIVDRAEREGALRPGGVIVEATSGNTGLALAMVASIRGYRCIFVVPDKVAPEKIRLLEALGAEVVVVPTELPPDDPGYYQNRARALAEEIPGAILADQYYNEANPGAHYETTGPELWEQSGGRITHFFAGAGTGGTISGTARFLKERNPEIHVVGVDPEGSIVAEYFRTGELGEGEPYLVEGVGSDTIPGNLHLEFVDEFVTVSDRDAFRMARRLAREEGLLVGSSTGLIAHAALEAARALDDPDAFVVTMLCDWGERYLSKVYDEEWLREKGLLDGDGA